MSIARQDRIRPFGKFTSYGGNPLAAQRDWPLWRSSWMKSFRRIPEEPVSFSSSDFRFVERFEFVGDARGRGLMLEPNSSRTRKPRNASTRQFVVGYLTVVWITRDDLYQSDSHYSAFDDFREVRSPGGGDSRRDLRRGSTRWTRKR